MRAGSTIALLTGFVEPVLFLIAFGYGVGGLVGTVSLGDQTITYAEFVTPALLAVGTVNGAFFDATFGVYFKMHYLKLYRTMLSTSLGPFDVALGEIGWAMMRGAAYAVGFLGVMALFGLAATPWVMVMVPAALLIALAFASIGMSITSYLASPQQLNWLSFATLPMFLFSGTFFPITYYPQWLQWVIQATPLWQAIALMRGLMFAEIDAALLAHVAYFVTLAAAGLVLTARRLEALFLNSAPPRSKSGGPIVRTRHA